MFSSVDLHVALLFLLSTKKKKLKKLICLKDVHDDLNEHSIYILVETMCNTVYMRDHDSSFPHYIYL